ncbi:MAG: hypothetical protein RLZZ568_865 [Cyanobacteriota bacterium]
MTTDRLGASHTAVDAPKPCRRLPKALEDALMEKGIGGC